MKRSLGVYVHIPFCARKCNYCDFPSWQGKLSLRDEYLLKLIQEMRGFIQGKREEADTVFIGGGTPSLLKDEQLKWLMQCVRDCYCLSDDCEVSMESNPESLRQSFLETAIEVSVNRLSMGVQTINPRLLSVLGRRHTKEQVQAAVAMARKAGFQNINLDLMFGLPTQTLQDFEKTLDFALSMEAEHLSVYGLIVEEETPMISWIEDRIYCLPSQEEERAMYDLAVEKLSQNGYRQYEISNFALPGKECRHNLGTWQRQLYHGYGVGAAGLIQKDLRRQNVLNLEDYLLGKEPHFQRLSKTEQMFESVMLGLRMTQGIDKKAFLENYEASFDEVYGKRLWPSIDKGLVKETDSHVFLTRRGMDLMNRVLLDLMDDDCLQ